MSEESKLTVSYIKAVAAPPETVNRAVERAKKVCPDFVFYVYGEYADCTIEIRYPESAPKVLHDEIMREILGELNEYVYALDNYLLAERLFQLLKLRRMKISVAESFTGGGVGKRLVEIPGISEVYFEGLNTYSNKSKIQRLNVREETLSKYGAVSPEVAYQMVEGLLDTGNCDVAISTTGIAGPDSDGTLKPVGLLYIGAGTSDNINVFKYNLQGDRKTITETAINLALFHAFKTVK